MGTRILKEDVDHDRVRRTMEELGLVPERPPGDVPEGLIWKAWATPDAATHVDYIADSFTKVRSVATSGDESDELEARLVEHLPLWDHDGLLAHALLVLRDGSDTDWQRAAYEVGMEMDGNGFDPGAAGVLEAYLQWDEPGARLAGARGFKMLPQPRFRLTAERLAKDPDPAVAAVGQELLERILELHGDTYVDEDIEPIMTALETAAKKGKSGKP